MRIRTDSFHIAGWKRAHLLRGCDCSPELLAGSASGDIRQIGHVAHMPEYARIEPAQPGDVWRLQQRTGPDTVISRPGYALTCPNEQCREGVHAWDHAYNCGLRNDPAAPSCWTWSGAPEAGNLTASPSLHVLAERGGCGWHGWLRNGTMTSV